MEDRDWKEARFCATCDPNVPPYEYMEEGDE